MLSISLNPSLLKVQNILYKANNSLDKILQRLSTGVRVNSASDDSAGYYVSQGLNSKIRSLKQVQNNITTGCSILNTAEDAMNNISGLLNQLESLALEAANTTIDSSQRNALQQQASTLVNRIKDINRNTTFNGLNVFGSVGYSQSVSPTSEVTHLDTVPDGYIGIYTAEDLDNVRNNLSGKYILMDNIDLSTVENWEPIGTSDSYDTRFQGTFDGNGYAIQNMTINRSDTDDVGLFGYTDNATIKNLGLENVNITGHNYTGALAGYCGGTTTTISNCYVTGTVTGNNGTGGLVGRASGATVSNSYSTASVTGKDYYAGGLIGEVGSSSTITNCYATGNVTGNLYTGGLLGSCGSSAVTNCYATGTITGNETAGGIVGSFSGEIVNCYTTSDVKRKDGSGGTNFGILFGQVFDKSIAANVFGNSSNSTIQDMIGSGSLNSYSRNYNVLNNTDFNSAATWNMFSDTVWDKSSSAPTLRKNAAVQRIDEIENCSIEVSTIDDLNAAQVAKSFKFTLMNDLDLSTVENWTPIGGLGSEFKGTFDGNGHVIQNMTIDKSSTKYVGLFGYTKSATIKNLGLENVNVTGKDCTGGLVGWASATEITNCYITGSVTGNNNTGGLVGGASSSNICKSYANITVTGNNYTGGLAGRASGTISDCYTTGSVTGNNYTGGLNGQLLSLTISNCYTNSDVKMKDGATGTYFGILFGSISGTNATATNVFGNEDKSTVKKMIGAGILNSGSSNTRIMGESEFLTASTWDSYDNNIWDKTEYPPTFKTAGESGEGGSAENGGTPNISDYKPLKDYIYGGSQQFSIQTSTNASSVTNIDTGLDLDILEVDFSSVESTFESIYNIKAAMDYVTLKTTEVGGMKNCLEFSANATNSIIENYTNAHSKLFDIDVAEETAKQSQLQILVETASSLLIQTRQFQANLLLNFIKALGK